MAKLSYVIEDGKRLLSYSTRQTFKSCPRKYQLQSIFNLEGEVNEKSSIDFAFGHAVAAGIQTLLATGNFDLAVTSLFAAWDAPFEAENPKSKKSLMSAFNAFLLFNENHYKHLIADWMVAEFEVNGEMKPAVELTFRIDLDGTFNYQGHIDLVLVNRKTKVFLVLELKTSSLSTLHEAMYKNSEQTLGYSIVLDAIARTYGDSIGSYSVLYLIYQSTQRKFELMPFTKTMVHRAEFLMGLVLDVHTIKTYQQVNFFPKNGSSCYEFFKPCEYFGTCDLSIDTLKAHGERIKAQKLHQAEQAGTFAVASADSLTFDFHIAELLSMQQQQARNALLDAEQTVEEDVFALMQIETAMPSEDDGNVQIL